VLLPWLKEEGLFAIGLAIAAGLAWLIETLHH